jgi:hypothetical protein
LQGARRAAGLRERATMSVKLYVHLKNNTVKNVCSEIEKILSAKSSGNMRKAAACEVFKLPEEVQAKFDEIDLIAAIIAKQNPISFLQYKDFVNVMCVKFPSKEAADRVEKEFEKMTPLVAVSYSGFKCAEPDVCRKFALDEQGPESFCARNKTGKPCLGKCEECALV